MDAIVLGNSLAYVQPAKDQSHSRQKYQSWMKFLDALDIDKHKDTTDKRTKQSGNSFLNMFARANIPIQKK